MPGFFHTICNLACGRRTTKIGLSSQCFVFLTPNILRNFGMLMTALLPCQTREATIDIFHSLNQHSFTDAGTQWQPTRLKRHEKDRRLPLRLRRADVFARLIINTLPKKCKKKRNADDECGVREQWPQWETGSKISNRRSQEHYEVRGEPSLGCGFRSRSNYPGAEIKASCNCH